jgi:hypothetical protein
VARRYQALSAEIAELDAQLDRLVRQVAPELVSLAGVKARTQAANQLRGVLVTAPEAMRHRLRGLSTKELVAAAARFRPGYDPEDVDEATRFALRVRWLGVSSTSPRRSPSSTPNFVAWWQRPLRSLRPSRGWVRTTRPRY